MDDGSVVRNCTRNGQLYQANWGPARAYCSNRFAMLRALFNGFEVVGEVSCLGRARLHRFDGDVGINGARAF